MGKGHIAFFVVNGKCGFHGVVGSSVQYPMYGMFQRIDKLLAPPGRKRFTAYKVKNQEQIESNWRDIDLDNEGKDVPKRWLEHRGTWSFEGALEAIQVAINEGIPEDISEFVRKGDVENQMSHENGKKDKAGEHKDNTRKESHTGAGVEGKTLASKGKVEMKKGGRKRKQQEGDYKCSECSRTSKAHRSNWMICCDFCDEWSSKECVPHADENGTWVCRQCQATFKGMRSVVQDWSGMKELMTEVGEKMKQMEEGLAVVKGILGDVSTGGIMAGKSDDTEDTDRNALKDQLIEKDRKIIQLSADMDKAMETKARWEFDAVDNMRRAEKRDKWMKMRLEKAEEESRKSGEQRKKELLEWEKEKEAGKMQHHNEVQTLRKEIKTISMMLETERKSWEEKEELIKEKENGQAWEESPAEDSEVESGGEVSPELITGFENTIFRITSTNKGKVVYYDKEREIERKSTNSENPSNRGPVPNPTHTKPGGTDRSKAQGTDEKNKKKEKLREITGSRRESAEKENRTEKGEKEYKRKHLEEPRRIIKEKKKERYGILFITDSLFRNMAMVPAFGTQAWHLKWELRMKRGGHMCDILDMIEKNEELLNKVKCVVICGGSNDVSDVEHLGREESEQTLEKVAVVLAQAVERIIEKGTPVGVIIPPSRNLSMEQDVRYFRTLVLGIAAEYLEMTAIDVQGSMEKQSFMRSNLADNIHFNDDFFGGMLELITETMGTERFDIGAKEVIGLEAILPRQCWRCGGVHARSSCHDEIQCRRCNSLRHTSAACLTIIFMCNRCGQRGHDRGSCQQ